MRISKIMGEKKRYFRFVSSNYDLSRFFAFYEEIFKNILHLLAISVTICDTIGSNDKTCRIFPAFSIHHSNCQFYIVRRVFMWNETGKGYSASEYQQVV